jgi:hypothetical protein
VTQCKFVKGEESLHNSLLFIIEITGVSASSVRIQGLAEMSGCKALLN